MTRTLGSLTLALFVTAACSEKTSGADSSARPPDSRPDRSSPDAAPPDTGSLVDLAPDRPLHDSQPPDIGAVTAASWVTIKPGSFTMGSPRTETCREPDTARETQHTVTLTRAFEIATTEVTQGQFHALMWYNPAKQASCGQDCPVELLNWHEAVAYCNALSVGKGLAACYACSGWGRGITCSEATAYQGKKIYDCPGYRLPTEAEWEYAYRAGTTTAMYNGRLGSCLDSDATADKIAWYQKNSGGKSHPVGKKTPNAWGLYDMAGGVWEWCHDWFTIDLGTGAAKDPWGSLEKYYRVNRGGSWYGFARNLRGGRRFQKAPTYRCHGIGLRPVRTVTTPANPDAGAGG